MAATLMVTNCVATPSSITVTYSDAVNSAATTVGNYKCWSPIGAPLPALTGKATASIDSSQRVVTIILTSTITLKTGNWLAVHVKSSVQSAAGATFVLGGDGFATVVNGVDVQAARETKAVEDAVAYPLLTEQVSFPSSPGGGAIPGIPPAGGGASLGQSVAKAVSDVLGWKANAADPKGFIGSLTQAFTLTEVEGHTEASWNPRTYAVQSDLGGAITGAQASLYTRAKDALDQSLPLLDGLYPLDPDADPEYVKALREMARSQMNEIVKELGTLGGPSVLRVNTYFGILLGPQNFNNLGSPTGAPFTFNPDLIQGTLGTLRDTYGIYFTNNPFSNSIEDEQDVTNFRVISDYMTSLLQTWFSNGQFFLLGTTQQNFFGTQLVLLSRQYSAIAETVNEVRFALDSVFIGPGERQTLLLQFANPAFPAMFLEDVLREIEEHATDEGPRLLQDGGRISVTNNILPIVRNYRALVRESHRPTNLRSLPDGYRTVRVQRALDDLHDQLKALIDLAIPVEQQVPAPLEEPGLGLQVLNVSPNHITTSGPTPVTIMGTGFKAGATVSFSGTHLITVAGSTTVPSTGPTSFLSENLLVANLTAAATGRALYNVTVTNPDGTTSGPLPISLTGA